MAPFPSSVAAYGKPGGGNWVEGDTLRLPDLGRALESIASFGPDAFYTGWIADSVAAQMKANGGIITKADLAAYEAKERAPVRGTFNGYEVIAMGPPSSTMFRSEKPASTSSQTRRGMTAARRWSCPPITSLESAIP